MIDAAYFIRALCHSMGIKGGLGGAARVLPGLLCAAGLGAPGQAVAGAGLAATAAVSLGPAENRFLGHCPKTS